MVLVIFESMRPRAIAFAISCAMVIPACNRDALGSGDGCTRSSECEAGLVCVEGACSTNLAGIGNPGTVPMLMQEAEMPAEGEPDASMAMGEAGAGADAATAPVDAAASDSGL